MKRAAAAFAILMAVFPAVSAAAETRSCLGMILTNGDGARFCYPIDPGNGWLLTRAEDARRGFDVAVFVLERAGSIRVTVTVHELSETSLEEASKILRRLWGKARSRRVMDIRRFPGHGRFLVSIEFSGRKTDEGRKAAEAFLKMVTIDVTVI